VNKVEFTARLSQWLLEFMNTNYSSDYNIEVLSPASNISKIANEWLKRIDGYTSFDFSVDLLGLLENKYTMAVEVILLNRSVSAISLKEIGVMNCYSKLVKPKHAFIVSLKGLPEEINLILLNSELEKKLLKISDGLNINVFKWNEEHDCVDLMTVFPINLRGIFI